METILILIFQWSQRNQVLFVSEKAHKKSHCISSGLHKPWDTSWGVMQKLHNAHTETVISKGGEKMLECCQKSRASNRQKNVNASSTVPAQGSAFARRKSKIYGKRRKEDPAAGWSAVVAGTGSRAHQHGLHLSGRAVQQPFWYAVFRIRSGCHPV